MIFLPIITIFFTALITKIITRSWFSPGSFFALCWSFFLFVPLAFASEYKVDTIGLWFIVIFTMSCATGSIIAYKPKNKNSFLKNQENTSSSFNNLLIPFTILSIISLLGLIFLLQYALNSYNFGYYSFSWFSIPNLIAIDRYSGDLYYPFHIKYSLYCIFPANLIGGLLLSLKYNSIKLKMIAFTPLFAAFSLGIIEGTRSSILLGLIIFFSAWLSRQVIIEKRNNLKNQYLKFIISGIIFILGFTLLFILIQWLRQGMDVLLADLLIDRIRAYFFGYLAAFSNWLVESGELNYSGGITTFAGPFNLLGILERPLGFYDPINISSNISTNIFTAFRGLIIDFSIIGSILIAFIIGFITQLFFQKNHLNKIISTLPVSIFYAFTLYSPLISIFHYNSILFSWIIVFLLIKFFKNEPKVYYS
jgi:oligosaccharide repeat unit polymerase